jgi:two-component system, LytTR family, response regulator
MTRNGMAEELTEIEFVEIVGIAGNAYQAGELLRSHRPDLLFLDIGMPGLSGLSLLKSLLQPPMVIIVTAYPEYALEGYELDVMDYLIKPVDFNRLFKSCCKAREFHELKTKASLQTAAGHVGPVGSNGDGYFFVKHNGKYEKIVLQELLVVEAADNYVIIYTTGKKFMVYDTLKNMVALLPEPFFMKVHKSFIVALDKVSGVEGSDLIVKVDGQPLNLQIPVSRILKEVVLHRILKR